MVVQSGSVCRACVALNCGVGRWAGCVTGVRWRPGRMVVCARCRKASMTPRTITSITFGAGVFSDLDRIEALFGEGDSPP